MDPNQQPNQQPVPQPPQPDQQPNQTGTSSPEPNSEVVSPPPLTPTDTPTPVEPALGAAPTPASPGLPDSQQPVVAEQTPSTPEQLSPITPVATPSPAAPSGDNPGKTLGIVSFVLLFIGMGLVSLILGIVALRKSKRAGHKNGFALAAIILGIVEIIAAFIISTLLVMAAVTIINTCSELGAGTHTLTSGATISCDEFVTQ